MGAIYQAAYRTVGFRVKRIVIREVNRYPIAVSPLFSKPGLFEFESVRRTTHSPFYLFGRLKPIYFCKINK